MPDLICAHCARPIVPPEAAVTCFPSCAVQLHWACLVPHTRAQHAPVTAADRIRELEQHLGGERARAEALVAEAVRVEREACAQIAELAPLAPDTLVGTRQLDLKRRIAAAIRTRGASHG